MHPRPTRLKRLVPFFYDSLHDGVRERDDIHRKKYCIRIRNMSNIAYPKCAHACVAMIVYLMPVLFIRYYPREGVLRTQRPQQQQPVLYKTYNSYTHRLLKRMGTTGINKHALELVNNCQKKILDRVCKTIVHLLSDTRTVTIREEHIRTAARVVLPKRLLDKVDPRIEMVCHLDPCHYGRQSLDRQCGLLFPPSRFRHAIAHADELLAHVKWRVSVASSIAAAVLLQTFTEMLLATAIACCTSARKRRIVPCHVMEAVRANGFASTCM